MGILTPMTSGIVSSAIIAFVYTASQMKMAPLYAMFWGVGQTLLSAAVGVTRILATLWGYLTSYAKLFMNCRGLGNLIDSILHAGLFWNNRARFVVWCFRYRICYRYTIVFMTYWLVYLLYILIVFCCLYCLDIIFRLVIYCEILVFLNLGVPCFSLPLYQHLFLLETCF